ncbi:NAD-dependent epimerase/dehydratase family protein [Methylophaga sp.]|uniref:NAD-dependent epimerase/dehydratase family protein n=1 Tax=Methylophaga sp. TaxID=2024840 RepID=UPI0027241A82|nr:NAD-dependent epimerase/dehydratase family protein [Methylophaga sp.]MDO8828405.1 NAD-dependent epimerase/dehydratase family protein [Methylophaga sp.]
MRVLVTGLDGFTGQYVEKALQNARHEVIGLTADLLDSKAVEFEIADKKPEAVIHLAAIAFVAHGDVDAIYQVNVLGTRNLLLALSKNAPDVNKVLLASSANIYGNTEGVMNESMLPAPANDYAVSKLAMEYMARLWLPKLPIVITRPFNYTGVGQSDNFLIPKIVSHFRQKTTDIELGNLDVWREFGDVRAVAKAYVKLLESAPVGEVFNICSGQLYALRDVIDLCQKITGQQITVKVNPAFVRSNEVKRLCGDGAKLHRVINDWQMPSLEETLGWMLKE